MLLLFAFQNTKHLEIIMDHVFSLECDQLNKEDVVTWSQEQNQSLLAESLPAKIRLINKSLWFFPAQPSHSGNYSCVIRYEDTFYTNTVTPSSSPGDGCTPLNKNNHVLRLNRLSESDSGNYTCLANFTQAGHVYTAARTFQVFVTVPGTHVYDLNCRVFIQTEDVSETFVYWLVNYSHTEEFPELSELHSWCEQEGSASYCQCNLSLDVHTEFLHVPFTCVALNSKGKDNGTVILLPASEGELYGGLALLTSFIILALGLLIFHLFKVDLVLSYRNCSPCLQRQNDGKLYDAYVSYPHGNDENTSSVTNFALRILPKVLEDDLGYRLFISGRDELPGAAVHDVIAEKVGKSRRLIIILSSQAFKRPTDSTTTGLSHVPAEHLSLSNDGLNWGPYECWVGVYDALIKGHLQVILIQLEGEVDVSLLPESLRYISHTQGILRWKQDYSTKPNGKFWKQLRYRMPPVRKAKLAAIV
uniref:TIR domain-containing protein n=1 Tax=Electrophorus electricus TaxID=8005 RepID=A0AAY5ENF5_ELEEL